MLDSRNRMEKVGSFYKLFPDEIKKYVFDNFSYANREQKRKFQRIRSLNEKIDEAIMTDAHTRERFTNEVYSIAQEHIPLDIQSSSYNDIINSMNEQNKLYLCAFFFKWCYETNENGQSNDDLYFDTFVDSDLFSKIINKEPLNQVVTVLEKHNISNQSNTNEENNSKIPMHNFNGIIRDQEAVAYRPHLNNHMEDISMKLVGRIEKRSTYYNFFPQYNLTNNKLLEIESPKTSYPTLGGINLAYTFSRQSEYFLENEIKADSDQEKYARNIYVLDVDNYDLEENSDPSYTVKLDLEKLLNKGKNLNDVIKPASMELIYKVVTCKMDFIPTIDILNTESRINIKEKNLNDGEPVLLLIDDKYFGPFTTGYRSIDDTYYIIPGSAEKKYIFHYFDYNTSDIVSIEKQPNYDNPYYTSCIHLTGNAMQLDTISDKELLDKIAIENISLESAIDNPDEFCHQCSISPFFMDLPSDLIQNRIRRIQTIANNTNEYQDTKRKVFDSLMRFYKENKTFEVSEELIKTSTLYQDLYSNYNAERRKNDDKDKRIQELEKENKEISKNQENEPLSNVSSAKLSEMEKRIQELIETNDLLKDKEFASQKIEELNQEITKLEQKAEFQREQNFKVKEETPKIQATVKKAIEEGTSEGNRAKTAFEPYISSLMLKEAAKWDSDEENSNYASIVNTTQAIKPSDLQGQKLIDYIVTFVQSKRDYSANDIINIYVSIAQNFITIFSGEPGTGKTSMCNIISDSLGLNNIGENLNRFVPVSVERGWSSKRDLIGYFNPLTKKYDKSNGKIYDALRILNIENMNSRYPFIIMLDEANLSPIEYYWADFMRLADRSASSDSFVNIGTENDMYIPETLRFLATINTDQTTEILSPRLIDRACIIKLPVVDKLISNTDEISANAEPVSWTNFVQAFSVDSELLMSTQNTLKSIYDIFNKYGMSVSPRIRLGIEKYVKAAKEIMYDDQGIMSREKAVDYAILQKLLPKINGYYSRYEGFFKEMNQICTENHLMMTKKAIEDMETAQERNMGYCQFLV